MPNSPRNRNLEAGGKIFDRKLVKSFIDFGILGVDDFAVQAVADKPISLKCRQNSLRMIFDLFLKPKIGSTRNSSCNMACPT